ncbi:hypothetical protein ARMGADRAFT_1026355 [Armillaria gallica]|uniref:Uncharacterized protein n=1 Tax=Armillaria gallica TaxID=47427 RepID=A0A2H3ECU2_ARMGA|nr:hypothetical protein ARMGADRAFT_1026355 [Armillaria gallica]
MHHTTSPLFKTFRAWHLLPLLVILSRPPSDWMDPGMQLLKATQSGFIMVAVFLQTLRTNVTHLVTGATALTAFNEAVQVGVVKILYIYVPPYLVLPYLLPSNVILLSAISIF